MCSSGSGWCSSLYSQVTKSSHKLPTVAICSSPVSCLQLSSPRHTSTVEDDLARSVSISAECYRRTGSRLQGNASWRLESVTHVGEQAGARGDGRGGGGDV